MRNTLRIGLILAVLAALVVPTIGTAHLAGHQSPLHPARIEGESFDRIEGSQCGAAEVREQLDASFLHVAWLPHDTCRLVWEDVGPFARLSTFRVCLTGIGPGNTDTGTLTLAESYRGEAIVSGSFTLENGNCGTFSFDETVTYLPGGHILDLWLRYDLGVANLFVDYFGAV